MLNNLFSKLRGDSVRDLNLAPLTNRRKFMRNFGLGAAGVAVAAASTRLMTSPAEAADVDIAVLQFALNLEYLEAEFYLRAATGAGIDASNAGPNQEPVKGGRKVNFTSPQIA